MTSICTQDFRKHGTVGVLGPSTELKMEGELPRTMVHDQELTRQTSQILVMSLPMTSRRVKSGCAERMSSRGMSGPKDPKDLAGDREKLINQVLQAGGVDERVFH